MINIIVQARMGSTRLPGKIMMKVKDKPLLSYLVKQISHSIKYDNLIIATTNLESDEEIVNFCNLNNIEIFRGSENDVLDRYYKCAKKYDSDIIVRITSDCPLIDPTLIDECISEFQKNHFDYFSNINKKINEKWIYDLSGYPLGFGVEVFTFNTLKTTWENAKNNFDREHVTQFILDNPRLFHIGNMENAYDYSNLRLAVDYQVDFDLIKIIIENFPENEVFSIKKIINFFKKNPSYIQLNSHIKFDEVYKKHLKEKIH